MEFNPSLNQLTSESFVKDFKLSPELFKVKFKDNTNRIQKLIQDHNEKIQIPRVYHTNDNERQKGLLKCLNARLNSFIEQFKDLEHRNLLPLTPGNLFRLFVIRHRWRY